MNKKRIICLAIALCALITLCVFGGVQALAAEKTTESRGEVDVYLIAGQSNAVGFGSDGLSTSILNDPRYTDGFEDVLYYGRGDSNVVNELVSVKVGLGKDKSSVGAEIGIASAVSGSNRMSAVIKHAVGASYLYPTTDGSVAEASGTWTPPSYIEKYGVDTSSNKIGDIYEAFLKTVTDGIALLKAEGYTPVVKGIWWMQGEAETNNESRSRAYEELLTMLIAEMKKDVGAIVGADLSSLPFVMGKITRNPNPSYSQPAYIDLVNAAQVAVTSKVDKTFIVDTGSLRQLDGWHYCADAQHWIGTQFIDAIVSADGKYSVTVNGANVNMVGGGAKVEGETVTVTFTPYENCTLNSVKMKIGNGEAVEIELDANGSYTFTMPESAVVFEVKSVDPNAVETEYGTIPSRFIDADAYPFVLFKNGQMIDAFENWNTFINSNGLSGCTLLMRRNYSTSEGADAWGMRTTPSLTIDLGGNVFTRGNYHMFQALGKNTNSATSKITVINGTLKANYYKDGTTTNTAPLIVFNNEAGSTVSDNFEIIFDGITLDLNEGRGIVSCFANGTVGSNGKVVLNNCTIDCSNLERSMTLFLLKDSSDNKNDVDVVINGGKLIVNDLSKIAMATFNDERVKGEGSPDSVTFGESQMVVELPADYTVPGSAKLTLTDGVFYPKNPTKNEATGNLVYELQKPDTPYGNIDPDKASIEDYPFVLFKNGEMIHAFKDFRVFIDTDAYKTANYQSGGTLLLRRDYSTSETSASNWAWSYIKDITIDLGGHTLTRGNNHLFNLISHGATANTTKLTVINGTVKANYYRDNGKDAATAPINFNNDSNSTSTDTFICVFENVIFDFTEGRGIVQSNSNSTYKTGKTVSTVTFNDCTFLRGSKTNTMTLFGMQNASNRNDISIIVNGGKLTANSADCLKNMTLATYSEGTPSPDSLTVSSDFEVVLSGGSAPANEYVLTAGTYFLMKKSNNSDSTTSYVFENVKVLETTYGNIATKYASKDEYPFVLFKNGENIHAFKDWKNFVNSEAYSTANYKSGCTLLLRRDYSTSEATGDVWALAYINDITIDLGGYTWTRGNYHLFNAISHGATTSTTVINVINGTLKANVYKDDGKTGASPVLCFNNDGKSTAKDNYFFNFTGITFDVSTGRGIVTCYNNGGEGSGTVDTITLTDCTIYRGSSTSTMTLFALKEGDAQKNDISVIINGGKIDANSLRSLTFATYDAERTEGAGSPDSFAIGSSERGRFEIVLLTTSAAPTGIFLTTGGVECVFVKAYEESKTTAYALYPSVMVDYKIKTSITLYSNFVYNIYIPVANVNGFAVNGMAVDYTTETIDNVEYYVVKVDLAAGETLKDIALCVTLNSGNTTVDANWTLNVYNYTKAVLGGDYNETTKTLMKDMLVYASAAHTYFKNTEAVAEKLAEIKNLLGDYAAEMPTGEAKAPVDKTYFTDVAVYLGEVPSFRFYLASGYTAADFTFKVGNRAVDVIASDDGKYVEIVMYAYMMLEDVTFTVKSNGETGTYNLYSYYEYATEQNNANLVAIVEALMKYSVSAKAYRTSVIGK